MVRSGLVGLSFILFVGALYLVFIYVPTEREMGIVQRIFYLMVPLAWLSMLAFLIIFISSILYLVKGGRKWDILANSSAEIGIVFTTLTLTVGSIWAKPVWGVWWTWSPRLTTTLVLWLIYLAYFMVRSLATNEQQGARFAAVVGIVGFIDVPIIGMSTTLWQEMHPEPLIFQGGLALSMLLTLIVSLTAFTALFSLLLTQRVLMKIDEIEISELRQLGG